MGGHGDSAVYHIDSIDTSRLQAAVANTGPHAFYGRLDARTLPILMDSSMTVCSMTGRDATRQVVVGATEKLPFIAVALNDTLSLNGDQTPRT
jgi:hypothetical protein